MIGGKGAGQKSTGENDLSKIFQSCEGRCKNVIAASEPAIHDADVAQIHMQVIICLLSCMDGCEIGNSPTNQVEV